VLLLLRGAKIIKKRNGKTGEVRKEGFLSGTQWKKKQSEKSGGVSKGQGGKPVSGKGRYRGRGWEGGVT